MKLMDLFGKPKAKRKPDSPLQVDKNNSFITPAYIIPTLARSIIGNTFEELLAEAKSDNSEIVEMYSDGIEVRAKLIRMFSDIVRPFSNGYYSFYAVLSDLIARG